MKVSENTLETPSVPETWPAVAHPVAPWWHTVLLAAIIIGVSVSSALQARSVGFGGDRIHRYAVTIAWECGLALFAWWGLWLRGTPLRQVLGERRGSMSAWLRDIGAAILFWLIAIAVLAALGALLRMAHLMRAQKAVAAIAPRTIAEVLVWVALCVVAGIVEEFVFRGYLLQQFSSLGNRFGARAGLWTGIIASSLLFGSAHGYEGLGGMIVITAYGIMFCLLAVQRRSLRSGMIAHAWHDAFTGILVAVAKHAHLF